MVLKTRLHQAVESGTKQKIDLVKIEKIGNWTMKIANSTNKKEIGPIFNFLIIPIFKTMYFITKAPPSQFILPQRFLLPINIKFFPYILCLTSRMCKSDITPIRLSQLAALINSDFFLALLY